MLLSLWTTSLLGKHQCPSPVPNATRDPLGPFFLLLCLCMGHTPSHFALDALISCL